MFRAGFSWWIAFVLLCSACAWCASSDLVSAADAVVPVEHSAAISSSDAAAPANAMVDDTRPHERGMDRQAILLASLTVFAVAVFLGFELINKVPPTLHTPLMSGSNAISGITVVGALIAAGTSSSRWMLPLLGSIAVALAMINVVGGFWVTHRMLLMFRRK